MDIRERSLFFFMCACMFAFYGTNIQKTFKNTVFLLNYLQTIKKNVVLNKIIEVKNRKMHLYVHETGNYNQK